MKTKKQKLMSRYLIYGLIDPRDNRLRYIGKSSTGMKAAQRHTKPSLLNTKSHKVHWIKDVINDGHKPFPVILTYVEKEEDLNQTEINFIKFYKDSGADLVNGTNGGEGAFGMIVSEDTRALQSSKRKEYFNNLKELGIEIIAPNRIQHEIIDGITYKQCNGCDKKVILEEFVKDADNWDGYYPRCKECHRKASKEYKEKNPIPTLSEQEWQQSYIDRSAANSAGVLKAYENNPQLKENLSKMRSKAIIGTHTITGETLEFPSALKAKENGYHNVRIGEAIKYNKPYKQYNWRFK